MSPCKTKLRINMRSHFTCKNKISTFLTPWLAASRKYAQAGILARKSPYALTFPIFSVAFWKHTPSIQQRHCTGFTPVSRLKFFSEKFLKGTHLYVWDNIYFYLLYHRKLLISIPFYSIFLQNKKIYEIFSSIFIGTGFFICINFYILNRQNEISGRFRICVLWKKLKNKITI